MARVRRAAWLAVAGLLVGVATSVRTNAQSSSDEIYIVTMNPTRLHGFHFDSGSQTFVEDDLDPSSSGPALHVGVDSSALAVTDRFFLVSNNLTDVALSIVDAATGVELPRPTTSASQGQSVTASPDGEFSYEVSSGLGVPWPPVLSVVDLRLSSPTLGREVQVIALPALPTSTGTFGDTEPGFAATTDSAGHLFASISENGSTGHHTRISTIDVSDPLAPAVLGVVETPVPDPPVTALHAVTIGGAEYLLAAHNDLEVYRVGAEGTLTLVQTIGSANAAYGARTVRDAVLVNTPQGDRLIVVTDVLASNGGARTSLAEELVVFDMTASGAGFNGSVLATTALPTTPTADVDSLALSADGATLFVLDQGALPSTAGGPLPGRILALRTSDVLAGNAVPLASRIVDATPGSVATAPAMVVRPAVTPAAGMAIDSIAVDGTTGAVLVNDHSPTISIAGSGLTGAQHVFVGPVQAIIQATTDSQITAIVPRPIPAETAPVLAIGTGGSARGTVTIANSPTYLPGHVVYATALGGNEVAVMNAATKTEVASRFATGQAPTNPVIAADGKRLFVADFRGASISVHSLVDDEISGVHAGDEIARIPVGLTPYALVINPVRPRLYVTTSPNTVSIIGIDPNDPATYLHVIDAISLGGGGVPRALAVTPDGQFLYVAGQREPFLTVINVSTDAPEAADITPITLNLNEGNGRTDGLAISPDGTRLYFMTQRDTGLRIFDISTRTAPVALTTVQLPRINTGCPALPSDVRTIQAAPDGGAVYVASRARGCVDVFDPVAGAFVASLQTGSFSADPVVTPDSQFVFVSVEQDDSVRTIDGRRTVNGAPNPYLYQVIAVTQGGQGTVGAAVSPGLVTPAGMDVDVQPLPGVTLTFDEVTVGGTTTVTSGNTSLLRLPPHFEISGVPVFFDVKTSATFSGTVNVCFPYDETGLSPADEANLRLLHEDNGALVDVTTSLDTAANRVCGNVSHFSQFVVAQAVNHPPVASAGPDLTVSVGPACTAPVRLDGTASSDPDGDALTYSWTGPFGTASGPTPTITVPIGKETVALSVMDPFGAVASASTTVTTKDTTPPVIAGLDASVPGRGHHERGLVPVTFTVSVADNCDPGASCRITAISAAGARWDERDDHGHHKGHASRPGHEAPPAHGPQWRLLGPLTALLRTDGDADRDDTYLVTVECMDAAGNISSRAITVTLPRRDHGRHHH
jgi:DNA-binding beta-propeller fold protein YncE